MNRWDDKVKEWSGMASSSQSGLAASLSVSVTLNMLKGMKLATVSWRPSLRLPHTSRLSCEPHQRFAKSQIKTSESSKSYLVNVYCRHPEKTVQAGSTQTKTWRKAQGCVVPEQDAW